MRDFFDFAKRNFSPIKVPLNASYGDRSIDFLVRLGTPNESLAAIDSTHGPECS